MGKGKEEIPIRGNLRKKLEFKMVSTSTIVHRMSQE